MARRRSYRRSRKTSDYEKGFKKFLFFCLFCLIIYLLVEHTEFLLSLVVIALVFWFILRPLYKKYMDEQKLRNAKGIVAELGYYLDEFLVDIPEGSRHSESLYQTDLGRYLKEKLSERKVKYEVERNGKRPDIVIDETIAIEVKSMKNPNSESNRKYNSQHVDSIYKKLILYRKEFSELIFIIFNSDFVRDRNWHAYEEMKDTVKEQGVTLIEK